MSYVGSRIPSSVSIVTMTSWMPELRGRNGPLYRAIADALSEDIDAGRLTPGTRLPTHRELAERVGVTVGTVTRAYAEAEKRGLVSGEVGRGTYVRDREVPVHMPTPVDLAHDDSPVELGINAPATPEGDPASQALRRSLEELGRTPRLAELLGYQPAAGTTAHRVAGAAWAARFGLKARPEQVVVCAGGQHAMEVALAALTRPGDMLVTEALTYPGVKVLARRFQLRLQGVAMDAQGLVPEAFEAACRVGAKLLYTQPTCHNPTGAVQPEERRRKIADVARKYGVLVLEDDAYGLLPESRPPPLASFLPEASYFIAGVSKLLTPGLRIGYLVAPARARGERLAEMRARWPFFSTRIDMLEMVLAKADADIARRYDERLVQPELLSLGSDLRDRLSQVIEAVLSLTGQSDLLDHSPKTQEAFSLRNTYLDPLHLMQIELLARSRQRQGPAESPLEQALLVSVAGIAAGLRNTG